jgi:hypothetical protein
MKYKFTRAVAHIEITFGVLIILAGVGLAAMAMLPTSWIGIPFMSGPDDPLVRAARALILFLSGLLTGALFIVGGQITLVFLDIARRVARVDRLLRRREQKDEPPDESRWINRLRQR